MATISKDKRKKIETKVLETVKLLDPSLINYNRYKKIFGSMTDAGFSKWFTEFAKSNNNFYIEVITYKNEPTVEDIFKAAKYLKCPLREKVTLNHLGGIQTADKVPVGYLFLKRQQQIVSKKNSLAGNIKNRNMRTGQVNDDSKGAHLSDLESSGLQVIGAEKALKEFMGCRADSRDAKLQMYEKINNEGYFKTEDLIDRRSEKVTLNTVNTLFLGAGIRTNLVNNSLLLPITLKEVKKEADEKRK